MDRSRKWMPFLALLLAPASAASAQSGAATDLSTDGAYRIRIDERRPQEAAVSLSVDDPPSELQIARDGDGTQIADVRCSDGRPLPRTPGGGWRVPARCRGFRWTVRLDALDGRGMDASLPRAAWSRRHGFWVLPERAILLRGSGARGVALIWLNRADGTRSGGRQDVPSINQPPLYAVIGTGPAATYREGSVRLRVFGQQPNYPWMAKLHGHVLSAWSRWRRDLVRGRSPREIDWVWIEPPKDLEPGYSASAGSGAIFSQIKLRPDDPDAEAKARAVIGASAAHEGFHTITGAAGQAWPAWVNESLANHFAIEAARGFLAPSDFRFVEAFYIAPDVKVPLLEAQEAYAKGDSEQGQVFYIHGARFWREVEQVLTIEPNSSGRLAALIKESRNFEGVALNDADAVAAFLDRHSGGRAGPLVRCYLKGAGCADGGAGSPGKR